MTRTKPPKTMDRQKEIANIKELMKDAFESMREAEQKLLALEAKDVTPEPKEPETWEEIVKAIEPQFKTLCNCLNAEQSLQIQNFSKRLLIADYCGRVDFVHGEDHYFVKSTNCGWVVIHVSEFYYAGTNYFPTREQAEKYLRICKNSNLL